MSLNKPQTLFLAELLKKCKEKIEIVALNDQLNEDEKKPAEAPQKKVNTTKAKKTAIEEPPQVDADAKTPKKRKTTKTVGEKEPVKEQDDKELVQAEADGETPKPKNNKTAKNIKDNDKSLIGGANGKTSKVEKKGVKNGNEKESAKNQDDKEPVQDEVDSETPKLKNNKTAKNTKDNDKSLQNVEDGKTTNVEKKNTKNVNEKSVRNGISTIMDSIQNKIPQFIFVDLMNTAQDFNSFTTLGEEKNMVIFHNQSILGFIKATDNLFLPPEIVVYNYLHKDSPFCFCFGNPIRNLFSGQSMNDSNLTLYVFEIDNIEFQGKINDIINQNPVLSPPKYILFIIPPSISGDFVPNCLELPIGCEARYAETIISAMGEEAVAKYSLFNQDDKKVPIFLYKKD